MKLFTYIWRNVTRNKLRSSLTILSVGFSLALMTILYGYLAMQGVSAAESDKHGRVIVLNKVGFASILPIAYVDRIRKIDGVDHATAQSWFGGNYKEQQMAFAQFGVEPEYAFDIYDEYIISDEQVVAFKSDRQGCVADKNLVERMNWELGERIPLQGTIYPFNLDLRLVGVFEAPQNTGSLWFNWNYLEEELKLANSVMAGNAGSVTVKCNDPDEVALMCQEIDRKFGNSEYATKTRTEAAFGQMFSDMLGDVQSYIQYISVAVVFALALVAATAMAMSMRERTTEVAVLKAIGFSKQRVLSMVLGESTVIAMIGGLLGVAGGLGTLHMLPTLFPIAAQFFPIPIPDLIGPWLLGLVLVAAMIGLVSGLTPAIMAARLSVVDGLRRVV